MFQLLGRARILLAPLVQLVVICLVLRLIYYPAITVHIVLE